MPIKGCTGACCERFTLPFTPEQAADGSAIRIWGGEVKQIIGMVEFLEFSYMGSNGVVLMTPDGYAGSPAPWYRCVHHSPATGCCGIYSHRPELCRRYPNGHRCEYPGCTYDGPETKSEVVPFSPERAP